MIVIVRSSVRWAAVLVGGAMLAACASIPDSGPVTAGEPVQPARPGALQVIPEDPVPDGTPQQIVAGFVDAMAAVDDIDLAIARKYLTDDASRQWSPRSTIVVYTRLVDIVVEGDQAQVSVEAVADIDESGRFGPPAEGGFVVRDYTLARVSGQWRVSRAPDGILVSETDAVRVLEPYRVYFGEPRGRFLVPDVRWFPARPDSATSLARALLDGPSLPLEGAVTSISVPGLELTEQGVDVVGGIATVDLTAEFRDAGSDEAQLLTVLMTRTLTALPGISEVRFTVEGTRVDVDTDADDQPVTEPLVGSRPYVLLGASGAASVSGVAPAPSADPSSAPSADPSSAPSADPSSAPSGDPGVLDPALVDRPVIAQVGATGQPIPVEGMLGLAARISGGLAVSSGGELFAGLGEDGTAVYSKTPSSGTRRIISGGVDLTAPSVDTFGWVWTVSQALPSTVDPNTVAGDSGWSGARVLAARGADTVEVDAVGLLTATDRVRSLDISRDGTRALLIIERPDQTVAVVVAGVIRDDGRPRSLTASSFRLLPQLVTALDATWVQSDVVAILGSDDTSEPRPFVAQIGGVAEELTPTANAVSITAGLGERSIVVGRSDGTIISRVGSAWSRDPQRGSSPTF